MDLLTNAVESVQVGVDDYRAGTRARLLSAVRNIHAGVLLLYKEALLRRSPPGSNEALIKAKIEPRPGPGGAVTFVGVGKKTVDVHQIRERFESLGIATDWKRMSEITKLRNDVEHYYPTISQRALGGLVASALVIVRDFAEHELRKSPRDLLGQETWDAMVAVADVHDAERRECNQGLAAVPWESDTLAGGVRELHCQACGSDLLRPVDPAAERADLVLACRACGEARDAESFVPAAVAEALGVDAYIAAKEGADPPYATCPECGIDAYVHAEGGCAYCGAVVEDRECARCFAPIAFDELEFAPLCSYCNHIMSKDD